MTSASQLIKDFCRFFENGVDIAKRYVMIIFGGVAEWLGRGLQILLRRFNSDHHLELHFAN